MSSLCDHGDEYIVDKESIPVVGVGSTNAGRATDRNNR